MGGGIEGSELRARPANPNVFLITVFLRLVGLCVKARTGSGFHFGRGGHGSYRIFHFPVYIEKRRIVKDFGDRRVCVDDVYIREMLTEEQEVLCTL